MNARQRRVRRRALAAMVGHLVKFRGPYAFWNTPHLVGHVFAAYRNRDGIDVHSRLWTGIPPKLGFVSVHQLRAVSTEPFPGLPEGDRS